MRFALFSRYALFALAGAFCIAATAGAYVFAFDRSVPYPQLEARFVPGLHGVRLEGTDVSFDPWELLEKNASLWSMVEGLCVEAGLPADCGNAENTRFTLYTKKHVIEVDGKPLTLTRGVTPLRESDMSREFIGGRLRLITEWAAKNQAENGAFPYMYYPSDNRYSDEEFILRQVITVQGLYALANYTNDTELYAIAERGERRIMDEAYHFDALHKYAYIADDDGIRVGTAALGILLIREKGDLVRPLTDEEKYLGEFLLAMQRDDGGFQTFLQDEPTDRDEKFYSGEALTALARLSAASDDPRYDDALKRGFTYYRAKLQEDFWPQYAPWHMQAYAIYYDESHDDEHAQYVYWLAEGLIQTMLEDDPHARADEEGRFFNPRYREWGPPHSSSTGIYLEGLVYAYELAKKRGDADEMGRFHEAILAGTRALLQVQWMPESAYYVREPAKVIGHFKTSITNNIGRIDQLGHAANALVKVQQNLW